MTDSLAQQATRERRSAILSYVLMGIVLALVFGPVFYEAATKPSDFSFHLTYAFHLAQTGDMRAQPHIVFHLFVIFLSLVLPGLSSNLYGWLAVLIPYIGLGLLIFWLLRQQLKVRGHSWLALLLVLVLLALMPIILLNDDDFCVHCILGYLNPTTYHNPTQNTLKLWVIPVSLLALRAFRPLPYKTRWRRTGMIVLAAVLVVLMSFTKPNYSLSLLPALGLTAAYKLLRRETVDWPLLVLGLGLPTFAVLVFQYLLTFGSTDGASIEFGFLTVMQIWTPLWQIPVKFLLSVAFPLAVYLLHFQQARRDTYLNFCWLVFGFGCVFTYLLMEGGRRRAHGNFVWTGYITLFVLMYASVVFMIHQYKDAARPLYTNRRFVAVALVFGLHVLWSIWYWFFFMETYVGFTPS